MTPIIHTIARIFSMISPPSKFVFPFISWLLSPILKIGGPRNYPKGGFLNFTSTPSKDA